MAEQIIYGVTQKITVNLGSQIFQEIGKLYGVQKEIEKLRGTVTRIEAILKDAGEQKRHNHQVKNWLEKLDGAVVEANLLLKEYDKKKKTPQQNAGENITEESGEETQQQNAGEIITEESGEETQQQNAGEIITEESGEETQQQNPGENITEESGEETQQQNAGEIITEQSGEETQQQNPGEITPVQKAGKKIAKEVCKFFSNSNQIAFYTQKKKNEIAFRFDMREKLKKIRKKLDAIVKDSEEFKL
ncbi:hypothetical protein ACB092_11G244100 [Castanea dentata]